MFENLYKIEEAKYKKLFGSRPHILGTRLLEKIFKDGFRNVAYNDAPSIGLLKKINTFKSLYIFSYFPENHFICRPQNCSLEPKRFFVLQEFFAHCVLNSFFFYF